MSVLATAVEARVPQTYLAQLTQIDSLSNNTVDQTTLELAVDDVTAMFETYAQLEFDSSDPRMLRLGVDGVLAVLQQNRGQDPKQDKVAAWRDRCREFAGTTSRARISPRSLPGLPATTYPNARPGFDPSRFDGSTPALPPAANDEGA
jgi:hypothetical protein